MKHYTFSLLFLLGASALLARPHNGGGANCPCATVPASTAPLTLDDTAIKTLQFQIDEERMAGDIYRSFGEKWQARPFQNIPRAEARHQAALTQMAQRAGLTLAKETTAGRYETPEVQARYDKLIAQGRSSLVEALKVGALIEEQDIADLQTLVATTNNAELKSVIAALEAGSRNHLRAFVRNLKARGIAYEPQVLPAEEVTKIIASDRRHGRAASVKQGRGRRHGGGCPAGKIATPPA